MRTPGKIGGGVPDICFGGDTDPFHKKAWTPEKSMELLGPSPLYNLAGAAPYSPMPPGGEGAVWLGLKGFGASGIVKFELKGTMGGKRSNGSAQQGCSSRLRDLAS